MDFIFTFIFFFFFFLISTTTSTLHNCPPLKCNTTSDLTIQHPFHIQNQECGGLPGFSLNCNQNMTTLHFPSYGDLVVKSISYDVFRVDLLDPNNCVHEVFLNLNLSDTPFSYYYTLKEYKYLKCLDKLPVPNYIQVPCLSVNSGFHFYIVETCMSVPSSCQHVKTVAIPFSYSPYLNDNSFGLRLSWKMSTEEEAGQHRGFIKNIEAYQVLGVAMILLVAMVLHYVRTSKTKNLSSEEEIEMENGDEEKVEALLGEYEALSSSPRGHSMFHVKLVDDFTKYQLLKGMR